MTKRAPKADSFSPAIRRNWGYWDGVSCRERGKRPMWDRPTVYKCSHPTDRAYGEGFWTGFYGEPHPTGRAA
jgi:hypothetical protein